jgi:TetR/AcrR family transcriptional regulator
MQISEANLVQITRIQNENRDLILKAALEVFSAYGFRGSTIDQIAALTTLSKPNILYYFRKKEDIYTAVLEHTLAEWVVTLRTLDVDNDPIAELSKYISTKLEMSFQNPKASRLFANEVLHGAPHVGGFLRGPLKDLLEAKVMVIRTWIEAGKIKPVEPYHFIFSIWAITQHYADFSVQVDAVMLRKDSLEKTRKAILEILLRGLIV